MGNSNRRASSPRPSQSGAVWDEANVLRLISEHKLAPKYGDSSSGKRSFECPICFLDFGILNTVNCCKQHICTDCLVQVKGSNGKGACPFCGNAELNACLIPLEKDKPASTPGNNPTKSSDDRSHSVNSETERSSGGSTKALSYTTPEQEKKLRSYSLDDTTPSGSKGSGSSAHTASKNDREALERQIREQRLQFDERDLAEATARSARSSRGTHQSGALYFRQAVRSRYGTSSSSTDSPFGAYSSRLAGAERTADDEGTSTNSTNGTDRSTAYGSRNTGNVQFVSSLEGLLQTHGSTRITSIQQLEDMMLMEAIRLSMQETGPSPTDTTNNNTSLPAPPSPARLSPFAPLSPVHSDSLRSTPVGRTTTSASSPFRAFLANTEVRVGASNDDVGRSSEDSGAGAQSEEDNDDDEGYEHEEEERLEYAYTSGVYGRYRERSSAEEGEEEGSAEEEEEEELDEEEQIRLAMELSLADMRASTAASAATTHTASNGDSAADTPDANANMMNAASSIDTSCIDTSCIDPLCLPSLTNLNLDHNMKNMASEKRPEEEYVLKPHAEDTVPTATSEADTMNTTDTIKMTTTGTETINSTSDTQMTQADSSTDGNVNTEPTVSPQAVFAEVRL